MNESGSDITAVLPHEIVKLRGQNFLIIVLTHPNRIVTRWSTSKIDRIEQEFEEIIVDHQSEEDFKKSLDECNFSMGSKYGWLYTGCRFPVLRDFSGDLFTVFPGNATVHSNFSIFKDVNNDFRTFLTNFLL